MVQTTALLRLMIKGMLCTNIVSSQLTLQVVALLVSGVGHRLRTARVVLLRGCVGAYGVALLEPGVVGAVGQRRVLVALGVVLVFVVAHATPLRHLQLRSLRGVPLVRALFVYMFLDNVLAFEQDKLDVLEHTASAVLSRRLVDGLARTPTLGAIFGLFVVVALSCHCEVHTKLHAFLFLL